MTSAAFVGGDFEAAYARAFGGSVNGGFADGGRDVVIPEFGGVQVKASVTGMREFLTVSLRRKQFIAICVGEPGAKEEMLVSLRKFGAWIGNEIPGRQQLLAGVAQVRAVIDAQRKGDRVAA